MTKKHQRYKCSECGFIWSKTRDEVKLSKEAHKVLNTCPCGGKGISLNKNS